MNCSKCNNEIKKKKAKYCNNCCEKDLIKAQIDYDTRLFSEGFFSKDGISKLIKIYPNYVMNDEARNVSLFPLYSNEDIFDMDSDIHPNSDHTLPDLYTLYIKSLIEQNEHLQDYIQGLDSYKDYLNCLGCDAYFIYGKSLLEYCSDISGTIKISKFLIEVENAIFFLENGSDRKYNHMDACPLSLSSMSVSSDTNDDDKPKILIEAYYKYGKFFLEQENYVHIGLEYLEQAAEYDHAKSMIQIVLSKPNLSFEQKIELIEKAENSRNLTGEDTKIISNIYKSMIQIVLSKPNLSFEERIEFIEKVENNENLTDETIKIISNFYFSSGKLLIEEEFNYIDAIELITKAAYLQNNKAMILLFQISQQNEYSEISDGIGWLKQAVNNNDPDAKTILYNYQRSTDN